MKISLSTFLMTSNVVGACSFTTAESRRLRGNQKEAERKEVPLRKDSGRNLDIFTLEDYDVLAPRIVGGNDASDGEYPFFVQGEGCGASLIWKDIVLTAAHCRGAFSQRVLVGATVSETEVRLTFFFFSCMNTPLNVWCDLNTCLLFNHSSGPEQRVDRYPSVWANSAP